MTPVSPMPQEGLNLLRVTTNSETFPRQPEPANGAATWLPHSPFGESGVTSLISFSITRESVINAF
jgi:hypothetical protein